MTSLVRMHTERTESPAGRLSADGAAHRRNDFTLVVSEESVGAPPHASPFNNYMGRRRPGRRS